MSEEGDRTGLLKDDCRADYSSTDNVGCDAIAKTNSSND
jgi:hypothetical protein